MCLEETAVPFSGRTCNEQVETCAKDYSYGIHDIDVWPYRAHIYIKFNFLFKNYKFVCSVFSIILEELSNKCLLSIGWTKVKSTVNPIYSILETLS